MTRLAFGKRQKPKYVPTIKEELKILMLMFDLVRLTMGKKVLLLGKLQKIQQYYRSKHRLPLPEPVFGEEGLD